MLCCAVLYYALWLCMVLCCTLFCGVLSCSMHVVVMSALKDGTRSRLFDLLDQNGDGVLTREEWLAAMQVPVACAGQVQEQADPAVGPLLKRSLGGGHLARSPAVTALKMYPGS